LNSLNSLNLELSWNRWQNRVEAVCFFLLWLAFHSKHIIGCIWHHENYSAKNNSSIWRKTLPNWALLWGNSFEIDIVTTLNPQNVLIHTIEWRKATNTSRHIKMTSEWLDANAELKLMTSAVIFLCAISSNKCNAIIQWSPQEVMLALYVTKFGVKATYAAEHHGKCTDFSEAL